MPHAPTIAVLGLGFGDEGKGTIVDWLVRRVEASSGPPPLVVRWNGGPQAAHHVVCDDGREHCFAQLGSGTFIGETRTHLGPDMIVDAYALHAEAGALARVGVADALRRVSIDPHAVMVTPWHALVNRLRETLRGTARHGSTGRGVAEAKLDSERPGAPVLRAADLENWTGPVEAVRAALCAVTDRLLADAPVVPPEAAELRARFNDHDLYEAYGLALEGLRPAGVIVTDALPAARLVVLEGAQGALLDRDFGFFPHVTPSRITRAAIDAASATLGIAPPSEVWGVLRAYATRHGAGPFPSETRALAPYLRERHNDDAGWSGHFRVGWFDAVLARWALAFAGPIDRLAMTCLDRLRALPSRNVVTDWRPATDLATLAPSARTELAWTATPVVTSVSAERDYAAVIETLIEHDIHLESFGPTASAKRERR